MSRRVVTPRNRPVSGLRVGTDPLGPPYRRSLVSTPQVPLSPVRARVVGFLARSCRFCGGACEGPSRSFGT